MDPPSIEVISSESFVKAGEGDATDDNRAGSSEGAPVSEGPDAEGGGVRVVKPHYGFNRQYSGVFSGLREEMVDVLHVPDPDNTPEAMYEKVGDERHQYREQVHLHADDQHGRLLVPLRCVWRGSGRTSMRSATWVTCWRAMTTRCTWRPCAWRPSGSRRQPRPTGERDLWRSSMEWAGPGSAALLGFIRRTSQLMEASLTCGRVAGLHLWS